MAEPLLRGVLERRGLRNADRQVDLALAAGAALIGAAGGLTREPEVAYELSVGLAPGLAGALAGAALLWRRRQAPAVFLVVTVLCSLATVLHWQSAIPVSLLLAGYALGAFSTPRAGLLTIGAALVVFAGLFVLRAPYFDSAVAVFNVAQVLVAWLVGLGVAHRRRLAAFARERSLSIVRSAADESERAVVAERLRIARLLHGRVSSALDEVASTAARARTGLGEISRSLTSIETAARQAAQDLRQLLGTLRTPDLVPEHEPPAPARWGVDLAIGLAVVVFNVSGTLLPDPSSAVAHAEPAHPFLLVLSVVPGVALLFRRHLPVTVLAVVFTVVVTVFWLRWPEGTIPAGLVIACYAVGAWTAWRRAAAAVLTVYAVLGLIVWFGPEHLGPDWRLGAVITVPWLIGTVVRHRRLRDHEDFAALRTVEEAQAVRVRRHVLEERLAVARDLHDVVSHNLSGIVIQAAAARRTSADEEDAQLLHTLEEAARAALQDLQGMVLSLQSPAARHPLPGLDEIKPLVARHREHHGPVTVTVDQRVAEEPESIQLTVFRVVQEALANAAKHAPGAQVSVRVAHAAGQVQVDVESAAGPAPARVVGSGLGLTGLAERVALLGGSFEATPADELGFHVSARLPSRLAVRG